ncbi:MAG: DMT family transporter [Oscillospiraceae bacterium]
MKKPYVKYIAAMLIFGTNGVVASHIALGSAEIVWSRTILGSLFLGGVLLFSRAKPNLAAMRLQWKRILVSGASMGLSWVFLFEAYRRSGVSASTLVYYCGPVAVMALSPLLFHERLTAGKLVGVAAVAVGMVFVNGAGLRAEGVSPGLLYALGSAALYAVLIVTNKRIDGLSGVELTLLQLFISCVVVAPYALLTHTPGASLGLEGVSAIIFLGVVNSGLACYLYFSSIHELPVQTVAICSYIDPASALIFSALLLGERLTPVQLCGAALIIGGAAFGELYRPRLRKTPAPQ